MQQTGELKESEEKLRALFQGAQDGILLANIDTQRIIEVNPAMCKLTGYTLAELLNLSIKDIHPLTYLAQMRAEFAKHVMDETHISKQVPILRKDGSIFPADVSSSHLHIKGQNLIAGFFRDVSKQVAAESQLQAYQHNLETLIAERTAKLEEITAYNRTLFELQKTKQQQLQTIIENLPAVFFTKNILGQYQLVNRLYEEKVGTTTAQLIGKTDRDLYPPAIADEIMQRDQEILKAKQALTYEETLPIADGSLHNYLTTKVPLLNDQGEAYLLLGMATDITQLKSLQQELSVAKEAAEQLMHIKSEFLCNISHEIRTPLNAILGLSHIGARDSLEIKSRELFTHIQSSAEHLLCLVNDILDFSKLDAGKLSLENRVFNLPETLEQLRIFVNEQAQQKSLTLSTNLAADLPTWVNGDCLRLRQILLNLLANAIKFTHQGQVQLAVIQHNNLIHFTVSDTGIGISQTQIDRLFNPFEQGDSSISRQYGGSGLGLAISQNLAQLMGGGISVASQPGVGSQFTLVLPLPAALPNSHAFAETNPTMSKRLTSIRVLAAEDIAINRFIIQDMLEQEGADVVFAENGQLAIEQLKKQGLTAFNVILMDVQMPVMDGYEATRRIKAIAPHLPVICLTAHALAEEKQRALDVGMVEHVTKPIIVDTLVNAILRHVKPATDIFAPQTASSEPEIQKSANIGYDSLAGIDINQGLMYCGGKWSLYEKMLVIFRNQHENTTHKLAALVDEQQLEAAKSLAHSIKGSAGYLGAIQLADAAFKLETACREADLSAASAQLGTFRECLLQVLNGLQHLDNRAPAETCKPQEFK